MKYTEYLLKTEIAGLVAVTIVSVLLSLYALMLTYVQGSALGHLDNLMITFVYTISIAGIVVVFYAAPIQAFCLSRNMNSYLYTPLIIIPVIFIAMLLDPTLLGIIFICSVAIAGISSILLTRLFGVRRNA